MPVRIRDLFRQLEAAVEHFFRSVCVFYAKRDVPQRVQRGCLARAVADFLAQVQAVEKRIACFLKLTLFALENTRFVEKTGLQDLIVELNGKLQSAIAIGARLGNVLL